MPGNFIGLYFFFNMGKFPKQKFFLNTKFIEGTQKKRFLGVPYGNTKPTIDLISIALVSEDCREYYAVSKDFNLKEAWNRYDVMIIPYKGNTYKKYWVRDNVLKSLWEDLIERTADTNSPIETFSYSSLKRLINLYGKTNKEIAEEVKTFVYKNIIGPEINKAGDCRLIGGDPVFYGYSAYYDWVVFCWLFGTMLDLPRFFPKYCIDLKQMLNEKALLYAHEFPHNKSRTYVVDAGTYVLRNKPNYPKPNNQHNALLDAKWNLKLYKFLKSV